MKHTITLFLFLFSLSAAAQKGQILGSVKDKNTQKSIEGAVLSVEGSTFGSVTDSNGNFKILAIPVGTYTLKASFLGYGTDYKYNIIIGSGNTQIVNFELEENNKTLDEITIAFNKFKSAKATDMVTPLSTQKLTTEEIKANPGGNFDVSKVIQVLPGVSGGTSVNRNDIIVRGGAPNENVYYLDGIEIPVLNHFQTQGASGGATGILNVSFIEDVQLTSSAFDARYDNVLAASFVIKQRNGNPEKLSGNVRLSGTELATTLEGPLGKSKKTTFMASARRSYLQFLFQALDLPIRPDYWDFQYKLTHKIDNKTTLTFLGIGAIDHFTLAAPKKSTPENLYILRANPTIDQWNYTFGVSLKRLLNNGFMNVSLSRNMFDNGADKFEDEAKTETFRTLKVRSQEIENKFRIDVNKYISGWKIGYGVMAQYVKYNAGIYNKIANEVRDSNNQIISPAVTIQFNSNIDFLKYGAFAQLSKKFVDDKLLVSFGLRTDMNNFTQHGNNPLNTLSPRVSISYQITPTLDVSATSGIYYKIPVYTNLGYSNQQGELTNQSMDYIRSNHFGLGLQLLPSQDKRFTLEGFYKLYNNYPVSTRTGISLANQGSEFTSVGNEQFLSIGEGRTYGVEFFMQQKLVKKIFYAFSTTIFKSEFSGLDGKLLPSSWNYGYIVATTLGYKFNKGWELGLKYRLSGGQPFTPFDPVASRLNYLTIGTGTLDYSAINSQKLAAFQQLDLRIDKKINFKKTTLDLYFDLQNALRFPTPGLSNYTFKRNETNTDFVTTDGQPIRQDGSNAIPLILENNKPLFLPTIGFILEF